MARKPWKPEETLRGIELAPKLLFSVPEAAYMLSLSYETVLETIRAGHMRAIHKGRKMFLHRDELERFAREDTPQIWLPQVNGKTIRRHSEKVA